MVSRDIKVDNFADFLFIIIIIYSFRVFPHQCYLMGFHWSLSESKSPQVSRTSLRILAVHCNIVVWIVSTRRPTSKSSRPFDNPLVIVPNAPITIGTIVTLMFYSFFNSLSKLRYLSFCSIFFQIYPPGQQNRQFCKFSFFFFFFDYYKVWFYGRD